MEQSTIHKWIYKWEDGRTTTYKLVKGSGKFHDKEPIAYQIDIDDDTWSGQGVSVFPPITSEFASIVFAIKEAKRQWKNYELAAADLFDDNKKLQTQVDMAKEKIKNMIIKRTGGGVKRPDIEMMKKNLEHPRGPNFLAYTRELIDYAYHLENLMSMGGQIVK